MTYPRLKYKYVALSNTQTLLSKYSCVLTDTNFVYFRMSHKQFFSLSESCWFCLASAAVEKHLVISIGSEVNSFPVKCIG